MAKTKAIKRCIAWLRRRCWHSFSNLGTDGIVLESPVHVNAGVMHYDDARKTQFSWESKAEFELSASSADYVTVRVWRRKHFWKESGIFKKGSPTKAFWFSFEPSEDDFSPWTYRADGKEMTAVIPVDDFLKAAEIFEKIRQDARIKEAAIHDPCGQIIGRDTSYEQIRRAYSNERLMKERGCKDEREAREWKPGGCLD